MKALHLLPGGTRGGMETLVSHYMHDSNHEHAYCALFLDGGILDELGSDIELYKLSKLALPAKRKVVKGLVDSGRFDLVVSHQWFGKPAIMLDSIHFKDVPLVVVLHSSYTPERGLRGSKPMMGFTRRLYRKADRVVAISRFVEMNHRRFFNLDGRAKVVHNAVDGERFERASDVDRPLSSPMRILYLGRLESIKGVDVLLRACSALGERGVAYDLSVVGWGSQRKELERLAAQLGVNVTFAGEVQDPERCYANADVFVHPAICDEGFGLTIIEAMAAGCLCIASDVGGLPEIIDDGVNGMLFERGNVGDLAEKLQRMAGMSDVEIRVARSAARARSRDFAWGPFVETYDRLFEDVVCRCRDDSRAQLDCFELSISELKGIHRGKAPTEGGGIPAISVVVPVYNVERYLDECIESICRQSRADIEIILVDDGSTDGCPEKCDLHARLDARIRVIHQENGGLSSARNAGIAAARADIVALVDSDDVVHPEMLSVLVGLLEREGSDIATCRFDRFDRSCGYSFRDCSVISGFSTTASHALELIYDGGETDVGFVAWNKVYRKRLFNDGRIAYPEGRLFEDAYTTHRLLYAAEKVSFANAPLYLYRSRPGSIIASKKRADAHRMDELDADFCAYAFFADKELALAKAATKTVLRTCIEIWQDAGESRCEAEMRGIAREVYEYVWGRSAYVLDDEPAKKVLYGSFLKAPYVAARLFGMV